MEQLKLLSRRFIIWRPNTFKKWDATLDRTWVQLYNSMATTPYGELEANFEDAQNKSCIVTASVCCFSFNQKYLSCIVSAALLSTYPFPGIIEVELKLHIHVSDVQVDRWRVEQNTNQPTTYSGRGNDGS